MEEKKTDKKPTSSPDKPISERLNEAEQSLRRKGKEASGDQHKAEDFLNRRR